MGTKAYATSSKDLMIFHPFNIQTIFEEMRRDRLQKVIHIYIYEIASNRIYSNLRNQHFQNARGTRLRILCPRSRAHFENVDFEEGIRGRRCPSPSSQLAT